MPRSTTKHACVLENKFNLALHVNTIEGLDHLRRRSFETSFMTFVALKKPNFRPFGKSVAECNWSEGNKCLFNVQITVAGLWELIRPGFCFLGADQLRSWVCQRLDVSLITHSGLFWPEIISFCFKAFIARDEIISEWIGGQNANKLRLSGRYRKTVHHQLNETYWSAVKSSEGPLKKTGPDKIDGSIISF